LKNPIPCDRVFLFYIRLSIEEKGSMPGTTLSSLVFVRAALVDADGRVLLMDQRQSTGKNQTNELIWDFPGVFSKTADPLQDLVHYLQDKLQVTTFVKAFFPLTFSLIEQDKAPEVTLLHGCRNWVGAHGLQTVAAAEGTSVWVKPARMGDYALTESCRMMMTALMTLLS
jgi:hypothetical protein